ncbi:hypothetical protein BDY21DRAFT_355873, partial [Lineolata rhizophorae]
MRRSRIQEPTARCETHPWLDYIPVNGRSHDPPFALATAALCPFGSHTPSFLGPSSHPRGASPIPVSRGPLDRLNPASFPATPPLAAQLTNRTQSRVPVLPAGVPPWVERPGHRSHLPRPTRAHAPWLAPPIPKVD